jgi:hypothetical protein
MKTAGSLTNGTTAAQDALRSAERSVVSGAVQGDKDCLAALRGLDPDALQDPQHRVAVEVIADLDRSGERVSPETVAAAVWNTGRADKLPPSAIADLTDTMPSLQPEARVAEIMSAWVHRQLLRGLIDLTDAAAGMSPGEIREAMAELLQDLPAPTAAGMEPSDIVGADDPPAPIFENGPVPGAVGVVIAESNGFKTWTLMQVSASLATGITTIPAFSPRMASPVVYWTPEDPASVIKYRLQRISTLAPGLDVAVDDALRTGRLAFYCSPPLLFRATQFGRVEAMPGLRVLDRIIADRRPGLVVLDPLAGIAELSDENSNAQMFTVALRLSGLAEKYGCVILLVHHASKARADEASQHMARGGSALVSRARWACTLRPAKSPVDGEQAAVEVAVVKDSYHRKAAPFLLCPGAGGELCEITRPEVSRLEIAQAVADWLRSNPEAMVTQGGLAQGKGGDVKALRDAILMRFAGIPGSAIAPAVKEGIRVGALSVEVKTRANRTRVSVLVPGIPSGEDDDSDAF